MKQLFYIENSDQVGSQPVLSLRLGEKHGSFAITDKTGQDLHQLAWCTTDDQSTTGWTEKELSEFFAAYPSLSNSFYEIRVAYDTTPCLLVSSKEYKQEDAGVLLSTQGGYNGTSTIVSELIAEWQLYAVYRKPVEIEEWISSKFPGARSRHQFSLEIRNMNSAPAGGLLIVDFRKEDFTVVAATGTRFLMAQTFDYSTPADVLYYLLKIVQQFALSQQQIQLQLSGLIDQQSSLYNDLYQYFKDVRFRDAGWKGNKEYPAHFFTSLNDLATCA